MQARSLQSVIGSRAWTVCAQPDPLNLIFWGDEEQTTGPRGSGWKQRKKQLRVKKGTTTREGNGCVRVKLALVRAGKGNRGGLTHTNTDTHTQVMVRKHAGTQARCNKIRCVLKAAALAVVALGTLFEAGMQT